METKTSIFNPIEMFHSDKEIAEFLSESYESEEPKAFISALGFVIKHKGVAHIAKASGLNRESLYKVINGNSEPKWSTVHKLLKALGVHLTVAA